METVVEMKCITKRFSSVVVLDNVQFDLRSNEVHALMGENGAGKSTLIKILAGVHKADEGEIYLDGELVEIDGVSDSQKLGISVIHQELSLAPTMTVAENIYLGRMPCSRFGFVNDGKMAQGAQKLLDRFGLDTISPADRANTLSVAQQQMIEILRALSTDCKILIMDEPTASLTDKEINKLFDFIHDLKSHGVAIVYISHRMEEVFQISDRITVFRDGKYIGTKDTEATDYEELVGMMVGREFKDVYPCVNNQPGEEVLRVEGLTRGAQVRDVSFSAKKGEILGFYGLMGSGRTETMRIIFGVDQPESGKIFLNGKPLLVRNVSDAINNGIMLSPENRKQQGLVLLQGIRYNISLSILKQIIQGAHVNTGKEASVVEKYANMLHIKARHGFEQPVYTLSGGNQQKVVLSKCMAVAPKVLILDEPTRGIDIGAKHELYTLITELADAGITVIFISSELAEIINLSTRVIVMHEGRVTGELRREELSEQSVLKLALGGVGKKNGTA